MDWLEPLLQNHANGGGTWRQHGITREQVLVRLAPIQAATPDLWPAVLSLVDEACEKDDIVAAAPADRRPQEVQP
jgi:putative hydrolase of HD superfamily